MTEEDAALRSSYLTPAFHETVTNRSRNDFRDLIHGGWDVGIAGVYAALHSGYTPAIYNAASTLSYWMQADEVDHHFISLICKTFTSCREIDRWPLCREEISPVNLSSTLELIQIELIEAIGELQICHIRTIEVISRSLSENNDILHFAALITLEKLGSCRELGISMVQLYRSGLSERPFPDATIRELRDTADAILARLNC